MKTICILLVYLAWGCSSSSKLTEIPVEKESWFGGPQSATQYSAQERMPVTEQRDYVRMTRERLERENEVGAQAGSMWMMDGQGSYLFVQNKARKEGDLLSVKLEGPALKQVEMKVSVIKKLLEQIEQENKKFRDNNRPRPGDKTGESRGLANAETSKQEDKEKEKLDVELIPSRIVEKLPDGNYRITGQQPFMLGAKEFKVLITGLVRAEDFSDEGISSNKLIEPDVDVLSVRKRKNESL